jgi:hypothetical protein
MSVKYSYFLTDWFGLNKKIGFTTDSKGSSYLEFNLAYEFIPTYTANFHAAHTDVQTKTAGGLDLSYHDYLIGVTKGFDGGWSTQLAWAKASYKSDGFYKPTTSFTNTTDTISDPGSSRVILSVGRTF